MLKIELMNTNPSTSFRLISTIRWFSLPGVVQAAAFLLALLAFLPSPSRGQATNSAAASMSGTGYQFIVNQQNTFAYFINDPANATVLETGMASWGPNWAWIGSPASTTAGSNGSLSISAPLTFSPSDVLTVALSASAPSNNSIAYKYTLTAPTDTNTTQIAVANSIKTGSWTSKITGITLTADKVTNIIYGANEKITAPWSPYFNTVSNVTKAVIHIPSGDITVTFDPPLGVCFQGDDPSFRFVLASGIIKAGATTTTITYTFPQPVNFATTSGLTAP
jgi:hypothetical protein